MKTILTGLFTWLMMTSFVVVAETEMSSLKKETDSLSSDKLSASHQDSLPDQKLTQLPEKLPNQLVIKKLSAANKVTIPVPVPNTTSITNTQLDPQIDQLLPKKWTVTLSTNPVSDFNAAAAVTTTTKLGFTYKIKETYKVSLAHAFESVPLSTLQGDLRQDAKNNNFRSMYTDIGLSSSATGYLSGLLSSDTITVGTLARILSHDSIYNKTLDAGIRAKYDLYILIPYTLHPKINLSFFSQFRHYQEEAIERDNDHRKNRFMFGPTIAYAVNDRLSIYQILSSMTSLIDGMDFRRSRERVYLETGLKISPPVKGLTISLNINHEKEIAAKRGYTITPFTLYRPNDGFLNQDGYNIAANGEKIHDYVNYSAMISYSF